LIADEELGGHLKGCPPHAGRKQHHYLQFCAMALNVKTKKSQNGTIFAACGLRLHVVRCIESAEAGTNYCAKELQGC
jgi:hypothetical protein